MKTIYLVRHGETIDDVENLYGGAADHEPTEKSLKDAAEFVETFKDKGVEVVIASPYLRAKKPATIIAQKLGVSLDFENDLREKNSYGPMSGMSKEKAKREYPDLVKKLEAGEDIEGGEKEEDFKKRVTSVLEKVLQRKEDVIAIVVHAGVIRRAIGFGPNKMRVDHYGFVKVTKDDGKLKILEEEGVRYL
jgi:broad specificity phosphatase PhoE